MPIQKPSRQSVLASLIVLNHLENEYSDLRPRQYEAKKKVEAEMERERKKLPVPILGHHDRIRIKGRSSSNPVINWVCRGCFIAVPVGLRSSLAQKEDVVICENCGSYIYMDEETIDLLGKKKFTELSQRDEGKQKKTSKSIGSAKKEEAKVSKSADKKTVGKKVAAKKMIVKKAAAKKSVTKKAVKKKIAKKTSSKKR